MIEIIPPVDIELLKKELTTDTFLRNTNYGGNQLYIITNHNAPNVLKEIGRLREITFRAAGGGTGKECDLDEFDIADIPYNQLIVWNPDDNEIIGGYRYLVCGSLKGGMHDLATSRLFDFSEKFVESYLPHIIELGRSFVVPNYQSSKAIKKGIYALDNLWDGLGALIHLNPEVKYFFGKVTMYSNYIQRARDMILYFLRKHFGDNEDLIRPIVPLLINTPQQELERIFCYSNFLDDYKVLTLKVRDMGEKIPPLINSYMQLSPTMRVFGTALNKHFGNVEETAILVTIEDIYKTKKDRHLITQ